MDTFDIIERRFELLAGDDVQKEIKLIDDMDDILFDSIIEMLGTLGIKVEPGEGTNKFLMEIRNQILEGGVENLDLTGPEENCFSYSLQTSGYD